jgi:hypothetical protein
MKNANLWMTSSLLLLSAACGGDQRVGTLQHDHNLDGADSGCTVDECEPLPELPDAGAVVEHDAGHVSRLDAGGVSLPDAGSGTIKGFDECEFGLEVEPADDGCNVCCVVDGDINTCSTRVCNSCEYKSKEVLAGYSIEHFCNQCTCKNGTLDCGTLDCNIDCDAQPAMCPWRTDTWQAFYWSSGKQNNGWMGVNADGSIEVHHGADTKNAQLSAQELTDFEAILNAPHFRDQLRNGWDDCTVTDGTILNGGGLEQMSLWVHAGKDAYSKVLDPSCTGSAEMENFLKKWF